MFEFFRYFNFNFHFLGFLFFNSISRAFLFEFPGLFCLTFPGFFIGVSRAFLLEFPRFFFIWISRAQVESIKKLGDMVTRLSRAGAGLGEHIIDRELEAEN